MIVAWMLYAALVGVLVAIAARAAELVVGARAPWTRWAWLGALVLTVGLVLTAPYRNAPILTGSLVATSEAGTVVAADHPIVPEPGPMARLAELSTAAGDWVRARLVTAANAAPAGLGRALGIGWLAASAAVLLALVWAAVRVRRSLRRWPSAEVQGVRVRVSEATGPAVVGLRPSQIVVPRWLLSLDSSEQSLILSHEVEHRRARDPLILAAGCAAAVALPWHPAVWLMLTRLRLAVELDCDARVLRGGVSRRSYGTLLIDLAGRCSGFPIGAPALADGTSHLERRLIAMKDTTRRPGALRAGLLALATLALGLAACEAEMPTAAEIDQMDAAAAEDVARQATVISGAEGDPVYYVDGAEVTGEEAKALSPERIARIEVVKGPAAGGRPQIRIFTKGEGTPASAEVAEEPNSGVPEVRNTIAGGDFPGIVFVDGVRTEMDAVRALPPDEIESIEVIKGPAATRVSDDPAAAHGIIRITTRDG